MDWFKVENNPNVIFLPLKAVRTLIRKKARQKVLREPADT